MFLTLIRDSLQTLIMNIFLDNASSPLMCTSKLYSFATMANHYSLANIVSLFHTPMQAQERRTQLKVNLGKQKELSLGQQSSYSNVSFFACLPV